MTMNAAIYLKMKVQLSEQEPAAKPKMDKSAIAV